MRKACPRERGGDLAADLAEMMVHRGGIADRHDQRRRFALHRADRTKHIGRGKAEILWCGRPAAGLPPHPGSDCSSGRCAPRPYMRVRLSTAFRPAVAAVQDRPGPENSVTLVQTKHGEPPLADTPALTSCQAPQLGRPRFAAKEICRHRPFPKTWHACLPTLPYLGITGSRYYLYAFAGSKLQLDPYSYFRSPLLLPIVGLLRLKLGLVCLWG